MEYREAQYFFWDSASLAGATQAAVARVDVSFFKRPSANNNASGITNPGATMFLVPAANGVPDLTNILLAPRCRVSYDLCIPTTDANTKTIFEFSPPVTLDTGKGYFFIMHYDGDEDFQLYMDKKGDHIVGTSTNSPGHPQTDIGQYFTFVSSVPTQPANTTPVTNTSVTSTSLANSVVANSSYSTSNWNPITGAVLKFTVYAARYAFNGDRHLASYVNAVAYAPNTQITTPSNAAVNLVTGCVQFTIPSRRYDYLCFDENYSRFERVHSGERCFQRFPYYPGGFATPYRISCTAGSDIIYCPDQNFYWDNEFLRGGLDPEHVICWSLNHYGFGQHATHVRRVIEIIDHYHIRVDAPCQWTNLSCWWHHSPVATIERIEDTLTNGYREKMCILADGTSNVTHRFTNHCFHDVQIPAAGGGVGYSNTDWIVFTGYENIPGFVVGGYPATANIVTNGNGTITAVNFSNLGCGFVYPGNIVYTFYRGANLVSNGSNCSLSCNIGAVFYSEYLGGDGFGGYFNGCHLTNIDVDQAAWAFDFVQPAGSFFTAFNRLVYYSIPNNNCYYGRSFHCDRDEERDEIDIHHGEVYDFRRLCTKNRCIPSWSNELFFCYQANGTVCNAAGGSQNSVVACPPGTSNSSVLVINTSSNGDYASMIIAPTTTTATFSKYIINNDYANEHTNYGNALAKGIEKKVTFANDLFAEDLIVFLTAYKPLGTDVQVYARIFNSADSESFEDKNWTRLNLKDGNGIYSSATDPNSFIELTYGFQSVPNVAYTLAGSVSTQLGNNIITGVGTTLSANLNVGDLVNIYQPLFPNTHQIAVVTASTNSSQITINDAVSNNDMVGTGLTIQKIGYPNQAFNNSLNDNVVRYYNSSMVPFDNYNSYQLKIVLLSNSEILVPRIDDVRAVGASS
jgi:hypothetical protein